MNLDPRVWFQGATIVARRDLMANVKSVRVIVISALMLLVMLGAAFGISGVFAPTGPGVQYETVMWVHPYYPTADPADAGALVWVSDAFGGPRDQIDIALGEPLDETNTSFRVRETKSTNASGWVDFPSLGPAFWPIELRTGIVTIGNGVFIDTVVPPTNFTAAVSQFDLLNDFSFRDFAVHVVATVGSPAVGATVEVNGTIVGATDPNGFFVQRFDPGLYVANVTYAGETQSLPFRVNEPGSLLPFEAGPDTILLILAFFLMGLFGPIVAIAVSYDSIAKERLQGSLELLLVRPASRAGLAVGKFLGTFASVSLPVLGVCLASLAGIAGLTGRWPDATFAGTFLVGTMGLLAAYVLIMQVISTFVRSPGTAVLSAILIWLVFNVLWNLVFLVITALGGIQAGSRAYFELSAITFLFNPTGVYQLTLSLALPNSLIGSISMGAQFLPDWAPIAAFVAWIVGLLLVAIRLFARKVV